MLPGTIVAWGGTTVPDGYLLCDGSLVSRAGYPDLFAVIGTAYSAGDGATLFGLPDLVGLAIRGASAAGDVGVNVGEKEHTLTVDEIPSHQHPFSYQAAGPTGGQFAAGGPLNVGIANNQTGLTGGGLAHNNVGPSLQLFVIIKT